MDTYSVATVGIADKDLTVLKSILNLVAGSRGMGWQLVEQPQDAHVAFLGHLAPEEIEALADAVGDKVLLVYCCSRGEMAPGRVRSLAHCPPRANELADVFAEALARRAAAPAPAVGAPPVPAIFEPERSLAGVIHARLLRLLIDQPLAVSIPGAPCLLVDVHNGLRTVHADPAWFSGQDYLRTDPAACRLDIATDPRQLAECRRQATRPYQALRWWGTASASCGRPVAEVARATEVGLKKLPDFKVLPHQDWQPRLAEAMVGKLAAPARWSELVGRPGGEVIDFLNACSVLGLLKAA